MNREFNIINKNLKKVFEINNVNVKRSHEESVKMGDNFDYLNR